jgi:hypothetical protein
MFSCLLQNFLELFDLSLFDSLTLLQLEFDVFKLVNFVFSSLCLFFRLTHNLRVTFIKFFKVSELDSQFLDFFFFIGFLFDLCLDSVRKRVTLHIKGSIG